MTNPTPWPAADCFAALAKGVLADTQNLNTYWLSLFENARTVFQVLDKDFAPDPFFIALPVNTASAAPIVGIQPHPVHLGATPQKWADSLDFSGVLQKISKDFPAELKSNYLRHDRLLRELASDIENCIQKHPNKPADLDYGLSFPFQFNGYLVFIALGLQNTVTPRFPSPPYRDLRNDLGGIASMVTHTCWEFFFAEVRSLQNMLQGRPPTPYMPADLVGGAARRFLTNIASQIQQRPVMSLGGVTYDFCNAISLTKYEGGRSEGGIVLAHTGHPALKREVSFKNPIAMSDTRAARKLLELAGNGLFLQSDGEKIFGLSAVDSSAIPTEDSLFFIHFIGFHHWETRWKKDVLFEVKNGMAGPPRGRFDRAKLLKNLEEVFSFPRDETAALHLAGLVEQASQEECGTMLIISDRAADEAARLQQQSTVIEPIPLKAETLKSLTCIDGAVLLSPGGICHAIGVILDGLASENGTPSRGARYNSGIRYVDTWSENGHKTLAVIVSEDGGVDIYRNTRAHAQ